MRASSSCLFRPLQAPESLRLRSITSGAVPRFYPFRRRCASAAGTSPVNRFTRSVFIATKSAPLATARATKVLLSAAPSIVAIRAAASPIIAPRLDGALPRRRRPPLRRRLAAALSHAHGAAGGEIQVVRGSGVVADPSHHRRHIARKAASRLRAKRAPSHSGDAAIRSRRPARRSARA